MFERISQSKTFIYRLLICIVNELCRLHNADTYRRASYIIHNIKYVLSQHNIVTEYDANLAFPRD
jgi:hypothetical protein